MFRTVSMIACFLSLAYAQTHSVCETERIDSQSAKEKIEKILLEEPSNTVCMLQLANIYLKRGQIARGFELLVDAYTIDPHHVENSQIATVLPFALKVTNLKQQAAKSNDKRIWNELGDGYFEMGIFSEAALMYKKRLGGGRNATYDSSQTRSCPAKKYANLQCVGSRSKGLECRAGSPFRQLLYGEIFSLRYEKSRRSARVF